MAATSSDLLKRLPPELRLDIYAMVLSTNQILHRPLAVEYPEATVGNRHQQRKYIFQEAVDILYDTNTFMFGLSEISGVDSAAFCRIQHTVLTSPNKLDLDEIDTQLLGFCRKARVSASHTNERKLALRSLTISVHSLASSSTQHRPNRHLVSRDIGLWTFDHGWTFDYGHPFTVQLEDRSLRQSWAEVKAVLTYVAGETLMEDFEDRIVRLGGRAQFELRGSIVLQAVALDLTLGVGFTRPGWLTRQWQCLPAFAVDVLHGFSVGAAWDSSKQPVRLKDVNSTSPIEIIGLANQSLLLARYFGAPC
ncbi:hypothetical protein LTR27_000244 [Elasticomyces elasticus]|nr:hypothetical protein LTR27_000244 [Elasticomyces elasticus]